MYLQLALGMILLVLECQTKVPIPSHEDVKLAPEESSNILSRVFFWWIHDILSEGYHKTLVNEELPSIGHVLGSDSLRHKAMETWGRSGLNTVPFL